MKGGDTVQRGLGVISDARRSKRLGDSGESALYLVDGYQKALGLQQTLQVDLDTPT